MIDRTLCHVMYVLPSLSESCPLLFAHRFLQAVEEMAVAVEPLFHDPVHGDFYKKAFMFLTEPERMISFHVPWYVCIICNDDMAIGCLYMKTKTYICLQRHIS